MTSSLGWMKSFPRPGSGVLLPVTDRRAAALGVTMYTASKPRVIALQRVACTTLRITGARILPGRRQSVELPFDAGVWDAMVQQWRDVVGPIDSFAMYRRREVSRTGLTMLAVRRGRSVGVLKVRPEPGTLALEQRALDAVSSFRPRTFRAPQAMGLGEQETWHWSIQEAVFRRPHAPALDPPPAMYDEIREIVQSLALPDEGVPAHGDVSVWNLRRDHVGALWLYDWENVACLPPEADRTYFAISAWVLRGVPLPTGLPRSAVRYWRDIWLDRREHEADGDPLPERMLSALELVDRTGVDL